MNPIGLLGPNGEPWTYCCGICGRIPNITNSMVIGRSQFEGNGRHPDQVESEKNHAELCCLCRRCREKSVLVGESMYCLECKPAADKELEEARENSRKRKERLLEIRETSLTKAKSKDDALNLVDAIRDYSDEIHWAGWHDGVEYETWELAQKRDNFDCGFMLELSESCGGWWYWSEEHGGELFVTIEEWEKMVAEWEKKHGS